MPPRDAESEIQAIRKLLRVFRANGNSATFFVTGRYYERNTDLIDEIVAEGFDVGYHSHTHARLTTKDMFSRELDASSAFLERIKPIGFRAPWIYLPEELLSALPERGFRYDSSTFGPPGSHYQRDGLDIFPVTSIRYFSRETEAEYPKQFSLAMIKKELPVGSGIIVSLLRLGYGHLLRHYARLHRPVVLYAHNWQLVVPKDARFNLFKDGLRYVHRYPMLDQIIRWTEQHRFASLGSRLSQTGAAQTADSNHYLTIDLE